MAITLGDIMTGAVCRVREPGCRLSMTQLLVLVGDQTDELLRAMSPQPDFHKVINPRLAGRQMAEQLRGVWIAEVQDLDGVTRDLITRTHDAGVPRQCVLIGTAKARPTPNDLLYMVELREPGYVVAMLRDRDQLWAEAAHKSES